MEIQNIVDKYYNKSFIIDGIFFNSKKELVNHIMSIINLYNEDEFLSANHQKFITDCLRFTDWGLSLVPDIFKIKIFCNKNADVLEILKNDYSIQELRVHGIFSNWDEYHADDVKFAMRYAIRTEERKDDLKYYNAGLSYGELTSLFFKENGLSYKNIKVNRVDKHLVLSDPDLHSKWVEFYRKNSLVLLLTQDEIDKITREKNSSKIKIKKSVICMDCGSVFTIKRDIKNTLVESYSICTECQVKRYKNHNRNTGTERSHKKNILLKCKLCGENFTIKSKSENLNLVTIPFCNKCLQLRTVQKEEKELNKKLRKIRVSHGNSHVLNSLSMDESKLKKHIVNGDFYIEN